VVKQWPDERVAGMLAAKGQLGANPNVMIDQTQADAGPMIVLKDSSWEFAGNCWTSSLYLNTTVFDRTRFPFPPSSP